MTVEKVSLLTAQKFTVLVHRWGTYRLVEASCWRDAIPQRRPKDKRVWLTVLFVREPEDLGILMTHTWQGRDILVISIGAWNDSEIVEPTDLDQYILGDNPEPIVDLNSWGPAQKSGSNKVRSA